uniref:Uncharacterized protein n=1 Tax=Rhizophora mucronata TaxID=61149 RepID=A0A2P2QVD5_RHIMU
MKNQIFVTAKISICSSFSRFYFFDLLSLNYLSTEMSVVFMGKVLEILEVEPAWIRCNLIIN